MKRSMNMFRRNLNSAVKTLRRRTFNTIMSAFCMYMVGFLLYEFTKLGISNL